MDYCNLYFIGVIVLVEAHAAYKLLPPVFFLKKKTVDFFNLLNNWFVWSIIKIRYIKYSIKLKSKLFFIKIIEEST
jgi:hypothetical protein